MKSNKPFIVDDNLKELSKDKEETLEQWIGKTKEERQFKDIVYISTPFHSNTEYLNNFTR